MDQNSEQQVPTALQRRFPRPQVPTDGLVLYYHPHNFYSQKILIALLEKRIPFIGQLIDISNGEQFSPWFLELNPKGEVPVLQNGVQIVPESGRILGYLEDHFASDQYVRLLPRELKTTVLERIVHFNRLLCRLPIGAISMGVFVHTDVGAAPMKPPMDRVTRATIVAANQKVRKVLGELSVEQHPQAETLVRRTDAHELKAASVESRAEFIRLLGAVHDVLDGVEAHLAAEQCTWLCSELFTIADLSLAMLLQRLSVLGLDELCWSQRRPMIAGYFDRVMQRESVRRSIEEQQNVDAVAAKEAEAEVAKAEEDATDAGGPEASEVESRTPFALEPILAAMLAKLSPCHVAAAVTVLSVMLMVPLYTSTLK